MPLLASVVRTERSLFRLDSFRHAEKKSRAILAHYYSRPLSRVPSSPPSSPLLRLPVSILMIDSISLAARSIFNQGVVLPFVCFFFLFRRKPGRPDPTFARTKATTTRATATRRILSRLLIIRVSVRLFLSFSLSFVETGRCENWARNSSATCFSFAPSLPPPPSCVVEFYPTRSRRSTIHCYIYIYICYARETRD